LKAGEDSRWIKWGTAVVKLATDGDSLNLKQATDIGSCQEVWLTAKGAARRDCRRMMWQVQVQEKVHEG